MRILKLFLSFAVCFISILSCVSSSKKDALFANLTDNSKFVLLPTGAIEQEIDMAQYLSAEFKDHNFFFTAWVKADKNAIEMTLFNEMGSSIGDLSYKNNAVNFSSAVIPKSFIKLIKPEYVIADFQLCFYDPILLENSLKDIGLVFESKNGTRRILNGNEVIIEIKKNKSAVELVNYLKGYAYTLEGDFHGVQ